MTTVPEKKAGGGRIWLTKPYKGATPALVSQFYHAKHKALDMVRRGSLLQSGYGTPLCAPEDCEVLGITGDTFTPGETEHLERGYGIYLKGLETGFTHQFWHTLPIHPVNVGDTVKRGQIVAYMGNAGTVRRGGTYVPLEDRLTPGKPGTHLHYAIFDVGYELGGKRHHINPLDHIGWFQEPQYTVLDQLKAYAVVLRKMSCLLA